MIRKNLLITLALLGSIVLFSGCAEISNLSTEKSVEKGDIITMNYTLMDENGNIIETSIEEIAVKNNITPPASPLEFKVGSEKMLSGINEGVIGMVEGEEKILNLSAKEAFGPYKNNLVQAVTIDKYQNVTGTNTTPSEGKKLKTQMGIITIKDVNSTHVVLDANSPLAGENVVFDITVESIEKANTTSTSFENSTGDGNASKN
ncbi:MULTISPECIES: FKBP-type peptidyl-prolyl cis-trans isomerase [Methanohalophilus]|nr:MULTISPECIES: FKBP-type peptidyl-prolyl cis-trans isomerase [Methanohalophilus]KXS44718.1 MAG: peptidylprolyl isomerase FKBP-type [Methanohalophilus sp. T328-1]OBZ34261.1 MAG: peptidylprolyl isomerase [Methanohalophilus sp. DAL1]ODV49978.1 MAG: peptidylprolyl isomerase FKBP-type [Methanohalophilus sp. 2-GBenrich]RSD34078.1 MAG: peptidylprolyl isomerase FKBP-type [Methanohalophilus sp.]PQV43159.1 FKBP-type peptidyl prolyl cis-trans isomerase /apo-metallochaperone SlyD [Methanohalophilus euha